MDKRRRWWRWRKRKGLEGSVEKGGEGNENTSGSVNGLSSSSSFLPLFHAEPDQPEKWE